MHGLAVYLKEGLPFARDLSLENSRDFDWLYFIQCLTSFSSINHFLPLYAPFLMQFHRTLMRFSQSTHLLLCLFLETLTSTLTSMQHLIYPLTGFGMLVFFTSIRLFPLLPVIDGFEWFWMGNLHKNIQIGPALFLLLMTFLMILSLLLLSMLLMLLSTPSVTRHLICDNN